MEPLQWSEVHLDFRVVTFQRSEAGPGYRVPINKTALAAFKKLRERGDGTGSVIRKPRSARTGSKGRELKSSRKWFARVLAEAGIKDLTWRYFRHTFGSRLRAARVQIEDIRYLWGYGAKSIAERYAHANLDVLRERSLRLTARPEQKPEQPLFCGLSFLGESRILLTSREIVGGREGIRTLGLLVANEAKKFIRRGAATTYVFRTFIELGNLGNP